MVSNQIEPPKLLSGQSKQSKSYEEWIVEQLLTLAEGLGEKPLPSSQRLALYAQVLSDVPREALSQAFLRALKECRFFPRPAELRELAEGSTEDRKTVEAQAAWDWILWFMRRCWYPDLGISPGAPAIPPAMEYALRQIGGIKALSCMETTNEPFLKRDFIAAYKLAPVAEMMSAEIHAALPAKQIKQLVAAKSMEPPPKKAEPIDFAVLRQQVEEKRQRDEEAQERRIQAGRERHNAQVEWLRKRGEL